MTCFFRVNIKLEAGRASIDRDHASTDGHVQVMHKQISAVDGESVILGGTSTASSIGSDPQSGDLLMRMVISRAPVLDIACPTVNERVAEIVSLPWITSVRLDRYFVIALFDYLRGQHHGGP